MAELGPAGSPSLRALSGVQVNTAGLNQKMAAFLALAQGNVKQVVRETALIMVARVQARTPVDTGRLRASIHAVFYDSPGGFEYTVPRAGRRAVQRAKRRGTTIEPQTVFDGTLPERPADAFHAVVGTNVTYALPIEAGWSKQAPGGMFRITLAELRDSFAQRVTTILKQSGQQVKR